MTYSKYQSKVVPLENNWRLNCLLPHLATITNPKGERHTSYFGFNCYEEAKAFSQYLTENNLCSRILNQQDLPLINFVNQEQQVS